MGKVPPPAAATSSSPSPLTEMMATNKKKKGRPFKNPPPLTPLKSNSSPAARRSTRRNPNHLNFDDDDDDDERKEKKVKLVVRLPPSDDKTKAADSKRRSRDPDSGSGSASGPGSDSDRESEGGAKRRKISGSDDEDLDQDNKEVVKGTDTSPHGSPLESGPTRPLPDKKLLVFILDRLQKKDTYGVFSEPVDPNELPDYFDIIEQPMDFGTVRKKLDSGAYKNLEELEADVLLICSNAMQYNSADTVYYRQARTIQDLATRDFKNLKHEGDDGQPKIVRRGRPPSNKNQIKKSLETTSPIDRVGNELSSGATLAKEEDKATGSNSYNLRKGPALFRYRSSDPFVSSYGSRNGENYSEWSVDWNNEFPASILRADMKYGKKQFTVDENRRDTYRHFRPRSSVNNSPVLSNTIGNMKRLVPVGLQEALSYARSLARYAANLGPVAWKMASKKIDAVLPAGVQYGPGWVGDKETPSQTSSISIENQKSSNSTAANCNSNKLLTPSTSDLTSAVRKLNSQNETALQNSNRNGFNGMFGYDLSSASVRSVKMETEPINDFSSSSMNNIVAEQGKLPESTNGLQVKASDLHEEAKETRNFVQQRNNISVAPDLNVRVPVGSPSSSLQIGSPQQPDLALQL